jgi:hypothetical protein
MTHLRWDKPRPDVPHYSTGAHRDLGPDSTDDEAGSFIVSIDELAPEAGPHRPPHSPHDHAIPPLTRLFPKARHVWQSSEFFSTSRTVFAVRWMSMTSTTSRPRATRLLFACDPSAACEMYVRWARCWPPQGLRPSCESKTPMRSTRTAFASFALASRGATGS